MEGMKITDHKELHPKIWEETEQYLASVRPDKPIREIYDPEVRKFLDGIGLLQDVLNGKYKGIDWPESFEEMKRVDYEIYLQQREDNIRLRLSRGLDNTQTDDDYFRLLWLLEKLDNVTHEVERRLSATYPGTKKRHTTSTSDTVEPSKYKDYILSEIKALEARIQVSNEQPESKYGQLPKSGFDTYIDKPYQIKLMPYLVSNFANKKPKEIVPMLYALEKLKILTCKVAECDQTNLHNTLTSTFGNIGGRTALNSALPYYHEDEANSSKKQKIEQTRQNIEAFLKAE